MKKIDEAVKRFGAPDYGRTAKRLRDFEAELISAGKIDLNSVRRGMPLILPHYDDTNLLRKNMVNAFALEGMTDLHFSGDYDERDIQIVRLRAEIEALQQLLNEKDYEIDMLRNIKPVSTRDLWFTAGLVGLVMLGAYLGFM